MAQLALEETQFNLGIFRGLVDEILAEEEEEDLEEISSMAGAAGAGGAVQGYSLPLGDEAPET